MARRIVDASNEELRRILEELLKRDEDITTRAVVRLHPGLANPSAISRNSGRQALVMQFQDRQREMRRWQGRLIKQSRDKAASELAQRDVRIVELEEQVATMRDSHLAMIGAVGEMGGMAKLVKFYQHHQEIRTRLANLGALPEADVKTPSRTKSEADRRRKR